MNCTDRWLCIGDDKIQNFLYHVSQIEAPSPVRSGHALEPSSASTLINNREAARAKRELSQDSDKAVNSLQQIGSLFLTSGQFRLVLNQVVSLFASIVADASGVVADKAGELEKQARETGDDVRLPITLSIVWARPTNLSFGSAVHSFGS